MDDEKQKEHFVILDVDREMYLAPSEYQNNDGWTDTPLATFGRVEINDIFGAVLSFDEEVYKNRNLYIIPCDDKGNLDFVNWIKV